MASFALRTNVPFAEEFQLCKENLAASLPGHPRIPLQEGAQLREWLYREFWAVDLENIAPRLWIMSTQSSANVSALHQQRVRGRAIIITEDPRLHLVWIYDRVFIKPLPKYLLSYKFWAEFMLSERSTLLGGSLENHSDEHQTMNKIRRSALGFLRTYYHLIRHESDFEIACNQEARLIPAGITWEQFCNFSKDFLSIKDDSVSERYHYGEIRLTRLNFYSKFLRRKLHYARVHEQYGAVFARFYAPLLFVFGIISIILSAMQVELGVETLLRTAQWRAFWHASRWFAIITLLGMTLVITLLFSLFVGLTVDEWVFALRQRYGKSSDAKARSSAA